MNPLSNGVERFLMGGHVWKISHIKQTYVQNEKFVLCDISLEDDIQLKNSQQRFKEEI